MDREPLSAPWLARRCAHGAGVGLLFGAGLLLSNVGGLGELVGGAPQPGTVLIFLAGSMFAFAPVVLCTVLAIATDAVEKSAGRPIE
jgi:hypothetical protein